LENAQYYFYITAVHYYISLYAGGGEYCGGGGEGGGGGLCGRGSQRCLVISDWRRDWRTGGGTGGGDACNGYFLSYEYKRNKDRRRNKRIQRNIIICSY